jgi:hypothetical protein
MELSNTREPTSCGAPRYFPSILWNRPILALQDPAWSFWCSLSFWLSYQLPTFVPLLPQLCPMSRHLILLDLIILIILGEEYNHVAPRYVAFSTLPLHHPSSVQTFSSPPCSQTPSVYVRLEVLTAVTIKNAVFWDVTLCESSKNRHFEGT